MNVEPYVSLGQINIVTTWLVYFDGANDARDDDEAAEGEDQSAKVLLLGRKLQIVDFPHGKHQYDSLQNNLKDGHGEPESQVVDMQNCHGPTGNKGPDRITWIAYFNDHSSDAPCGANGDKYCGSDAEGGGEEDAAIKYQDGGLDQSNDWKVEDAVYVYVLNEQSACPIASKLIEKSADFM
ncbi:MAG: hypothetical protein Q9181_008070, partial [Wetmoreana brouardii]